MCITLPEKTRFGERLSDGSAHEMDHSSRSRRQFLKGMGMVAAGASLSLGGIPVRAFAQSPLLSKLALSGTNRILVMVQLSGGNDGLNTVVPFTNDLYYNARPGIALAENSTIPLTQELGFHPSLAPLEPIFGNGDMAIVQGVGYPTPTLSHFKSTDVWMTASSPGDIAMTGWSGRHLDTAFPTFSESPPDSPLAVQIGSGSPLLLQGPAANMGMSLFSVDLFERIAETGKFYDEENIPGTVQGNEIAFVRSVANDSFRYAGSIQAASEAGQNDIEYANTTLAKNMAIIAQLIKGGLGSSVYHVNLSGFDTHANQLTRHADLLTILGEAVDAFQRDIEAAGMEEEVLVMTFSEFGRRVNQNGSAGTDHGTAAPMFLFGAGVSGGLYGEQPSLSDLDNASNMMHTTDFRSVYASVLSDWFGLSSSDVADVLGVSFPLLSFISDPTTVRNEDRSVPDSLVLEQNYPNPFNPSTRITFTLGKSGSVKLTIYDVSGRTIIDLIDTVLPAGRHEVLFEAGHLPSGLYIYRLRSGERTLSKTMTLVK